MSTGSGATGRPHPAWPTAASTASELSRLAMGRGPSSWPMTARSRSATTAQASIPTHGRASRLQDIIRRAPFCLGQVVYRRGEDVRAGIHEPIISPEQAHAARRAATQRTRRSTHHHRPGRVYVLARIAHCACGLRLRGETLVRKGRKDIATTVVRVDATVAVLPRTSPPRPSNEPSSSTSPRTPRRQACSA